MFPAASYQYVLYGMGFSTAVQPHIYRDASARVQRAQTLSSEVRQQSQQFAMHLPQHRQLLEQASQQGFARRPGA